MGDVVRLQRIEEPRRSARRIDAKQQQPCQILIFTGVRYERWSDETTPPAPAPAPKRRRRRNH